MKICRELMYNVWIMTKNFIWMCCAFLVLIACGTKSRMGGQPVQENYDSTLTAVIPWDSHYPFDSLTYRPGTVTQSEIELIDDLLLAAVNDYNNSLPSQHADYKIPLEGKQYKKQLVAVLNPEGEKEVWVNCFCDTEGDSWRNRIIVVFDGGPCFFNFKVNLRTKKVYELLVNGFA